MTKTPIYRYLGTNGVIESPIFLEGIYSVHLVKLDASNGMVLTNGNASVRSITVPESETDKWSEVEMGTNN